MSLITAAQVELPVQRFTPATHAGLDVALTLTCLDCNEVSTATDSVPDKHEWLRTTRRVHAGHQLTLVFR